MNASERLQQVIDREGQSTASFARIIDLPEYTLRNILQGKVQKISEKVAEAIVVTFTKYNKLWLLTGEGPMMGTAADPLPSAPQPGPVTVPIIPHKLYNETQVDVLNYLSNPANNVPFSEAVPHFPTFDCYYYVNTSAMEPHFYPSDLLALKKVSPSAPIVNGEAYLINSFELGIILRFVYDRGDQIELCSSSERYESFFIKKSDIVAILRIIGLVRTNN